VRYALLVTGASGMALPRRFLQVLAGRRDTGRVHLVVSAGAAQVLRHELGPESTGAEDLVASAGLEETARARITIHRDSALDAPISSGSYRLAGTVILPCSAATLGALSTGSARTLVHRAGAVALKERWPLVLGFRETPLSIVHLENLRRLAYAGATILPPIPAFYVDQGAAPDLDRFLDHYVLRIFDALGIAETGAPGLRWPPASPPP
jgi:4-hydroxy-3-polyprenylbenzoate decarboxylase